jgi:uncharacterized protein YdeI (YjbR/CyaY-like superfamily)
MKPAAPKPELETIPFETPEKFRDWLDTYHKSSPGIWLKMYKKDSGIPSINYKQALDEALCYGWIDGQSKKGDDLFYIQKFVPRGKRSMWSQRNKLHIARLTEEGKMMPAGIAQVEAAKADGRWDAAYAPPSEMFVPEDFLAALNEFPEAESFYNTLNRTNTYAIAFQLATAKKAETRARRFEKLLNMMKEGKKLH